MSLTYPSSIIGDRLQVVIDAIDSGAGNGQIQIGTAGMALVLSTVTLLKPCATISSGVLTFSGTPLTDPAAAAGGLAAAARITTSAGSVVASGLTVGLSSQSVDIVISLQNVTAGSIVTFVSGTITGH